MSNLTKSGNVDPRKFVKSVLEKDGISDRKLRLFLAACCRQAGPYLDHTGWDAVEAAEALAEGSAKARDIAKIQGAVGRTYDDLCDQANEACYQGTRGVNMGRLCTAAWSARSILSNDLDNALEVIFDTRNYSLNQVIQRRKQSQLAHCVFGSLPYRASFDRACITADVAALAKSIYDRNIFGDMVVLATALEGAGCANHDVLQHCRRKGEHARGCWVIDPILAKN